MNQLIISQLPIQGLLIQNHFVVLWLGQSKEYLGVPRDLVVNVCKLSPLN